LCVGVGGDRTHASRPGGAGYARLSPTRLGQRIAHASRQSEHESRSSHGEERKGREWNKPAIPSGGFCSAQQPSPLAGAAGHGTQMQLYHDSSLVSESHTDWPYTGRRLGRSRDLGRILVSGYLACNQLFSYNP
jgi:hypothetical protein